MTNDALAWLPARQQQVFRRLMTAFSYPGRVQTLEGADGEALRLILATLVDGACSLSDTHQLLAADDRRRLGASLCSLEVADFIVTPGAQMPEGTPRLGSLENPEQGATVVLAVSALGTGASVSLRGPGIDGEQLLHVSGVEPAWWSRRAEWNAHFPMGVDIILVSENAVAALPRTTHITVKGAH
jgi:alpha-D-ribose 1-methylphosphonate 5-triphosphate synthase subunit PhnH